MGLAGARFASAVSTAALAAVSLGLAPMMGSSDRVSTNHTPVCLRLGGGESPPPWEWAAEAAGLAFRDPLTPAKIPPPPPPPLPPPLSPS